MRSPTLLLHGDVGREFTVSSVAEALRTMPNGPLSISLHSFGGDALAGIGIHNLLARHPGTKTVIIEGVAASAASLIAMAGDRRVMPSNAFLMIHDPVGGAHGSAEWLRSQADLIESVGATYRRTYAARTGQSETDVAAWMAQETWFDAAEAVAAGLATETTEPAEIQACATRSPGFTRMPEALRRFFLVTLPAQPGSIKDAPMTTAPAASATPPTAAASGTASTPLASLADLETIASRSRGVLGADWMLAQLRGSATVEAAREAAIDAMAAAQPPRTPWALSTEAILGTDHDAPDARLSAMSGALAARILGREPGGPAERYRGWSLPEMAREMLEARGTRTRGWKPHQLIEAVSASMSTSDLPNLLIRTGNVVLADAFRQAQSPIRTSLCRPRTANDFRELTTTRVSSFPALEEVPEAGPVQYGALAESGESYSVASYARNLAISRQAMVNDSLDAFGQATRSIASAAAEAEARKLVALLSMAAGAGPTLSDGTPLFHASRGNLAAAGSTLDVTNVSHGRTAMRTQQDLGDGGPVGIGPKFLLVGAELETTAEQLLASVQAAQVGEVNPFSGRLTLLVEPRLVGSAWWLFASPQDVPVLEIAHLDGRQVPTLETFTEPGHLGLTFRATLDFGAGVVGWRGSWRNPGAGS